MISIQGTEPIIKWLNENLFQKNLAKYQNLTNNNNNCKMIMEEQNKFSIKVYKTNLITIEGTKDYPVRIYNKLIDVCNELNYIGSDEVGVGDFFGPTVYVSVLWNEKTKDFLKKNQIIIKDSKKFKDKDIIEIYQKLKNNIDYSFSIMYDKDNVNKLNSVAQKVYNHNINYYKLKEQQEFNNLVIDLFTTVNSFTKYSEELNLKWPQNIILENKADSKYLSVGLASMIARGIFLEEMNTLEAKYNFKFPLGANNVKKAGAEFIQKYSKEELSKFAKTSFKTFNEI